MKFTGCGARRMEGGFTLLELLIVMMVVSLTLGLALPGFRPVGGANAATTAAELAAMLAVTRARAMATGRPESFSLDDGRIQTTTGLAGVLPAGVTGTLSVSGTRPGVGRRTAAITFFPDGGAFGGVLRLTGRGADAVIEVDWLTGAIRRGS